MPRKYIRKSDRVLLSDDLFRTAQQLVQNGCSTRFAAKVVGASVSGLRKRLSRGVVAASLGRHQTFTREQEYDLMQYCQRTKGTGITRNDLRVLAFEYAKTNNIKNQFVQSSGMAGYDWVRGFLKRHPEVIGKSYCSDGLERPDYHLLDLSKYKPAVAVSQALSEADASESHVHQAFQESEEMTFVDSDSSQPSRDPIKVEVDCDVKLAEFQAEEELEFGPATARAAQTQPEPLVSYQSQRVAASAPPPLPQSANPMFWPEEPQPKIRPGPGADECQIFGDFVASELRTLRSDESRKRLKRIIQKAILNIGEEEDVNIING